uniref:Uncharacterized protein n=1 Tax=Rhizophora mucronata TaxID=61149 RepID=A0A2P2IWF4_RHIMU
MNINCASWLVVEFVYLVFILSPLNSFTICHFFLFPFLTSYYATEECTFFSKMI